MRNERTKKELTKMVEILKHFGVFWFLWFFLCMGAVYYNTVLIVLGSTHFQVMECGETYNLLSPSPTKSYDTYLAPVEDKPETITKSPPRFESVESLQKRRLSPDSSELDTSFKRRRNSSFIGLDTPAKIKFKDILKTPLDIFSRRRSISSSVSLLDKSSLNDSTSSTVTSNDILNQSCSSLQFVSTPVKSKTSNETKNQEKFTNFKSPSLFATPKHKSLFKKGFRKSFMEPKSSLKNITEIDPNCSIDDVDVSVCESVRNCQVRCQAECSFVSLASSTMEVEESAQQNFRLPSSNALPVLNLFIFS